VARREVMMMLGVRTRWWAVLLGSWLLLAGCGSSTEAKGELTILCGSSFVKPTEELIARFQEAHDVEVQTSVAGSEDFLPLGHVGDTGTGDVLVTHDPFLDLVDEAGRLAEHALVGHLAPVLAVRPGNPQEITSIDDLTRPGLAVALTDPKYSTCGEMVYALLEKKGIKDEVLRNVDTRLTKGHSTLGTWLELEQVDAVVMWNGVANSFSEHLTVVKTPYEYDSQIRVHFIGLNYAVDPDLVRQFVEFATEHGPAIFAEHGYVK